MAKFNLRNAAKEVTTFSDLMSNRQKIDTADLVGKELTIRDFDMVNDNKGKPFIIYIMDEYENSFAFGGQVLTNMFAELIQQYGLEDVRKEVQENGLKVKLSTVQSKSKNAENGMYNSYTKVEVL